jgi:hypothetical protein
MTLRFLHCSILGTMLFLLFAVPALRSQDAATSFRKQNSYKCEVAVVDKKSTKILGHFFIFRSEGEREVKSFRIPRSRFYIIAAVGVDDEGLDATSMELGISKDPRIAVLNSSQYAFSRMPPQSDVGSLAIKIDNRKTASMFCTSPDRETK